MATRTFKSVDSGSPKYSLDGTHFFNLTRMPRMRTTDTSVIIPIDMDITEIAAANATSGTIEIKVASDTTIINETSTGGQSVTYGPGAIAVDALHDKLNVLFSRNFLMA